MASVVSFLTGLPGRTVVAADEEVTEHMRIPRGAPLRAALVAAVAAGLTLIPLVAGATTSSDTLTAPAMLGTDRQVVSSNGNFRLIMQSDGNLVLYTIQNRALWSSRTYMYPGGTFVVQSDGNLVIYAPGHGAVWSSGTYHSSGSVLRLGNDGDLVFSTATGAAVWATHTNVASGTNDNPVASATLRAPGVMAPNTALTSPHGAYRAVMQGDGNFVVYQGSIALWASGTYGHAGAHLALQSDNNLIVYSTTNAVLWTAHTGNTGANQLLLGDDGELRLYDPPGNVRWQSQNNTYVVPSGSFTVTANGNGHGHGMSQYGARGAAIANLSAAAIVAFYYPGTVLTTLSSEPTMRVQLSAAGSNTCLLAKSGLHAGGPGLASTSLPAAGRIRLVPSGSGIAIQASSGTSCTAGTWTTVKVGGGQVDVSSSQGYVRTFRTDGTSVDYRGTVGAVRSGTGEITVNRVSLDDYTAGVAPREMPASWQSAAVQAQAIAARSYGEYGREHSAGSPYDICDTDSCQVYGGMTRYAADGTTVLWTDDQAAATATARKVLTYGGTTIFAQFSASDGGWTVDGGQPYLVAKADGYDDSASGDPYLGAAWTSSGSSVAGALGLRTVTLIQITSRDGHGVWGGRVLSAVVTGTTASGAQTHLSVTGFDLADALGIGTTWFVLP